jgi:hypothetical protein
MLCRDNEKGREPSKVVEFTGVDGKAATDAEYL